MRRLVQIERLDGFAWEGKRVMGKVVEIAV